MAGVTDAGRGRRERLISVVYSELHRRHNPRTDVQVGVRVPHPESPARADQIIGVLARETDFQVSGPRAHGLTPVETVHASGLVRFLADAATHDELIADTLLHPRLREGMGLDAPEPADIVGRLGYWSFDTGTPLLQGTYAAAREAVDVALTAADLLLQGRQLTYGLCRPPGHHAARMVYGGFCYFNNAAIAADYLVRQTASRIAILDVDYHHGNGTQQIFYERNDVLYVSLHADPVYAYPYFTGHAEEIGAGAGRGSNLNLPLPSGTHDTAYLEALERAVEAVVQFGPAVTLVSLGIDTYVHDPLGDFALSTTAYVECGRRVRAIGTPVLVVQEGGYYVPELGQNVRAWLRGAA